MLAVFVLVTAVVLIGHLIPGLDATGVDHEIRNALHVIGFAVVTAVIFEALPVSVFKATILTFLFVVVLGVSAEAIQKMGGKEIDFFDLYRDMAGAVLYLGARLLWRTTTGKTQSSVARFSARVVSIALGALIFVPLGYWLFVNAQIKSKFPVILDFDGRWDEQLYVPIDSQVSLRKADSVKEDYTDTYAEFLLLRRSWSGLKIATAVSDWSSFQFLTMRAAIVGGYDSKVVVHISDGEHPGYRIQHLVGGRSVSPEPTTIRFPLRGVVDIPGRPDLDPSNIEGVYIIGKTRRKGKDKSGETRLLIDEIRLE